MRKCVPPPKLSRVEGFARRGALQAALHLLLVTRRPGGRRSLVEVILCGGFSGHGFKFAPVIGEIAADLALTGETPHDIGFLSLGRFSKRAS